MREKLREVLMAVLPIMTVVLLIHFILVPLTKMQLILFFWGTLFVLVGLSVFLLGVEISISKMGYILGRGLTKKGNVLYLLFGGAFIGFIVSVAEPSLTILGFQIQEMSQGALSQMMVVIVVSIGVALFLSMGMLRIVYQWSIKYMMLISYIAILLLSFYVDESFFTFAFDASGATTGAMTVPFVLAMSSGISRMTQHGESNDDMSFGLVGIASVGPILAMLFLGILKPISLTDIEMRMATIEGSIYRMIALEFLNSIQQVLLGVIPLIGIYIIYHFFIEKQSKQTFRDIIFGLGYIVSGLVIFLTGVSGGFMPIGQYLGGQLYQNHSNYVIIFIGFILGVIAILAEPAIYVLIDQIEEITGGTLSRKLVLWLIAISVGFAIALTIVRVVTPGLKLWHVLLPGYLLIMLLSFQVSDLFVGLGFDSGGVASGPMTGTFIFAFVQGISIMNPTADPLVDGFGMIALVAMVPILFIEILGYIYLIIEKQQQE